MEDAHPNLKCDVCGENQFDERDGFYYCQECGTKQDQVRLVEVVRDDEFDQEKLIAIKKKKIQAVKAEMPQLTSWECYNYILRGFVEELLTFGAKEELKLMALQVWAAYLRRRQVAFFNRKHPDLPKLGVKYLENDVKTIYNHSKKLKKRQRRRSEDTSCTSGGENKSLRHWRKSKRSLDELNYSLTSATSGGSGLTSSTSTNSNRAIKLGFNLKARAYLKRKMHVKHIPKHEADSDCVLTCHKQPTAREINRTDYNLMLVNIKLLYSIIAIALNLIGDEIQLSDLVRFINERRIGTSNVLQYFPENIADNGKEMLRKINFYKCPEKYSDSALRDHIGIICKNIGIHSLKTPDIIKLVRRYTTELCLPMNFADYIERLINLLPPQFNCRAIGYYPGFEARAMAYIIFTLKLFYGLDDHKEHRISRASQSLNSKIELLNRTKDEKQPLLFVWSEWLEYIEMRKVIVSQFNTSFAEQFKQCQSTKQLIEQQTEETRTAEERDLLNESSKSLFTKERLKNFKSLFERFQETYQPSEENNKPPLRIDFSLSFTPAHSYMKTILLLSDKKTNTNSYIDIKIPDFMRIDHSQRDINSYLQVKPLIEYFKRHELKLNVHVLATTENKRYIGIFRSPFKKAMWNRKFYKACSNVTEEEWAEKIISGVTKSIDDLEFRTDLTSYKNPYYHEKSKQRSKRNTYFDPNMNYNLTKIHADTADQESNIRMPKSSLEHHKSSYLEIKSALGTEPDKDLQSLHSFELFRETDMDPIDCQNCVTEPRRNLENIDLFEEISDEESVLNDDDDDTHLEFSEPAASEYSEHVVLNENDSLSTSEQSIFEEFIKLEPESPIKPDILNKSRLQMAKEKNNKAFKNHLKMYISNMDCWMILGSILMLNKAQQANLKDKFPRSFIWLLETCAQTINVEWSAVFEQLLCIETMFCLGINDPKTITNCVYINSHHPLKEIQKIMGTYRDIW